MADPICLCGHYKSIHYFHDLSTTSFCTDMNKVTHRTCPCREYRLDNLRFLEQKANER